MIVTMMFLFLVFTQELKAQFKKYTPGNQNDLAKGDSTEITISTYEKPDWKTIDINFLSSYYVQEGNNSPVTGGIGTEQLTDFTQKVIISAPLTNKFTLNLDGGYDYYSSASTDNINNVKSSDSSSDLRMHGNVGFNFQINESKNIGFRFGGSGEYDYASVNGGMNFGLISNDKNTSFNLGLQAFFDTWVPYFPSELRGRVQVPTDKRQSYNASMTVSRVLNKRMQFSVQLEGVYMKGLLSTPFHRVYFLEQQKANIENLPNSRLKTPIGLRLNTFITENLIARTYYRFYWDNWGIKAHTASLELPIKLNRFFWIYPFYRFHIQNAATYFKPYKEHNISEKYYSSDFDLSAFTSQSYGVGITYSPPGGLLKIKIPFRSYPFFVVKGIDLKYSHYDRSTGLKADIISIGVSFSF